MTEMKTHQTAVVLVPPLEHWEPIQDIRRRYDRQFKRWMPHITLLYPFRPEPMFDEIGAALAACCAGIEPFDLELKPAGFFEHNERSFTMWLSPEPAEAIVRLQAALLTCAPDCDDVARHPGGFRPHLSVGQAYSKEELDERLRRVRSQFSAIRFRSTEIALIRRGPGADDPFQVKRLIPLGRCE